jgi:hypothetical protein
LSPKSGEGQWKYFVQAFGLPVPLQDRVWARLQVPGSSVSASFGVEHQGKIMRYLLVKGAPLAAFDASEFRGAAIVTSRVLLPGFGTLGACLDDGASGKMSNGIAAEAFSGRVSSGCAMSWTLRCNAPGSIA